MPLITQAAPGRVRSDRVSDPNLAVTGQRVAPIREPDI
jgi:hypothetical protein